MDLSFDDVFMDSKQTLDKKKRVNSNHIMILTVLFYVCLFTQFTLYIIMAMYSHGEYIVILADKEKNVEAWVWVKIISNFVITGPSFICSIICGSISLVNLTKMMCGYLTGCEDESVMRKSRLVFLHTIIFSAFGSIALIVMCVTFIEIHGFGVIPLGVFVFNNIVSVLIVIACRKKMNLITTDKIIKNEGVVGDDDNTPLVDITEEMKVQKVKDTKFYMIIFILSTFQISMLLWIIAVNTNHLLLDSMDTKKKEDQDIYKTLVAFSYILDYLAGIFCIFGGVTSALYASLGLLTINNRVVNINVKRSLKYIALLGWIFVIIECVSLFSSGMMDLFYQTLLLKVTFHFWFFVCWGFATVCGVVWSFVYGIVSFIYNFLGLKKESNKSEKKLFA